MARPTVILDISLAALVRYPDSGVEELSFALNSQCRTNLHHHSVLHDRNFSFRLHYVNCTIWISLCRKRQAPKPDIQGPLPRTYRNS